MNGRTSGQTTDPPGSFAARSDGQPIGGVPV